MATISVRTARSAVPGFARSADRAVRRVLDDPHVLLASGLAVPTVVVHLGAGQPDSPAVIAIALLAVVVQVLLATAPRNAGLLRFLTRPVPRLTLAVVSVAIVSNLTGDAGFRPLVALYVPVVTIAAMYGGREALTIATLAGSAYLGAAVLSGEYLWTGLQRGFVLVAVATVLVFGTRRTVASLEHALQRLRATMAEGRRRARQVAAVEATGRALAARGPDTEALDQVMELLHSRIGFTHVSIYLGSGGVLRLGAQRGYVDVVHEFDGTRGVIGRVIRNRRAELVRDPATDPDFIAAAGGVTSEICAPLIAGDDLLGVVNVETTEGILDETDVESVLLVADRIASALALARERRTLAERAELFRRLTAFGPAINAELDPDTLYPAIIDAVGTVIPSDRLALTVLDRATGRYFVRAALRVESTPVGSEIRPGAGLAGRAIRDRATVVEERFRRTVAEAEPNPSAGPDRFFAGLAAPIIRDGVVVGALAVGREDLEQPFSPLEREVLDLLATQIALAITNSFLHGDVTEAAIRDPLTGLHNRRYLDASVERMLAARSRLDPDRRIPLAAILFDLDLFGMFNKRHGHRVGDAVLRGFAGLLKARFRAGDLVARYGGEEFIAILEGATLDDAVRIAEELRQAWAEASFPGIDGEQLRSTVSAGCARLTDDARSVDDMFAAADVGLAMAKAAGRNLVVAA